MKTSKSFDKRTGITYVYEITENHWDPVKKRGHPTRRLIGKIDPVSGEIVPTGKRGRPPGTGKAKSKSADTETADTSSLNNDSVDWKSRYVAAEREIQQKDAQIAELRAKLQASEKRSESILSDLSSLLQTHQL